MRLILASTSPRRHDLLSLLGISFEVADPLIEEQVHPNVDPIEQARMFAEHKAGVCADRFPDRVVIGGDTLIACDEKILGKPATLSQAASMLRMLRGREHQIHTAVAVTCRAATWSQAAVETVRVWLKAVTDDEIDRYLGSGESMGKAGAYAIQGLGADLVARIEGDYTAAVGLPLRRVAKLLQAAGIATPISVDALYRKKGYPNWDRFA